MITRSRHIHSEENYLLINHRDALLLSPKMCLCPKDVMLSKRIKTLMCGFCKSAFMRDSGTDPRIHRTQQASGCLRPAVGLGVGFKGHFGGVDTSWAWDGVLFPLIRHLKQMHSSTSNRYPRKVYLRSKPPKTFTERKVKIISVSL